MACRVGMSTTPYERIEHWKREEGHTSGSVLHSNLSYSQATEKEAIEARARGCTYHPGGEDNGQYNWSVYIVSGGTIR